MPEMPGQPFQATCIALGERGVLVTGRPGAGKSALALALIDRGAALVGDDGVLLTAEEGRLFAAPHPLTRGLLEVRNLGLLPFPCRDRIPVALVVHLDEQAPRYVEHADEQVLLGLGLPLIRLWPEPSLLARKVELALARYGLADAPSRDG